MGPYTHEQSRELEFDSPALLGAIPLADRPVEPLRGKLSQVTSAIAKVTNLNQDLTKTERQIGEENWNDKLLLDDTKARISQAWGLINAPTVKKRQATGCPPEIKDRLGLLIDWIYLFASALS